MERPKQHIIDSMGGTQLRAALEGRGWTLEEKRKDYGIDYDVEVFRDGKSTGITFKIQLKSSVSSAYSKDGDFISEEIKRSNAVYLCKELRVPVLLVHADVRNKKTFWTAPQLDSDILGSLAAKPSGGTFTFRIPTKNQLPENIPQLLDAVAQAETLLSTRSLLSTPVPDFLTSVENRVDKGQVGQELKNKSDAIRLSQAEELFESGSFSEVRIKIQRIISDPEASVENRFWALLTAERLEVTDGLQKGMVEENVAKILLTIRAQMKQVTRKGPHHLKFFSVIALKAAELYALTSRDLAMYLNWKINKEEDAFWKAHLAYHRARLTSEVVRKYGQCMRLVGYAVNSRSLLALPHALMHIAEAIAPFAYRLKDEGLLDAAAVYTAGAFRVCQLAGSIASLNGDDNALGWAAGHAAAVVQDGSSPIHRWAEETVAKIKNKEMREAFVERLRKFSIHRDDDSLSLAEEQRVYESMASALGIDLTDSNDSIARIVRIGIADFDPTRVLKNCQHLFVSLGSSGLPAEMLQLPTAGSKFLHCTLKSKTIGGVSLDRVYEGFKAKFCDGCAECKPHAADWSYSHRWQREQNERHKKFVELGQRV